MIRAEAQNLELSDSLATAELIDSLFVDHNIENYSIRGFVNFKNHSFRLGNKTSNTRFIPNNRSGVGFGFATNKILIDIAFNIKMKEKQPTDRFDLQASFKHKAHYFDYFFQRYKGFNVESPDLKADSFRPDITSISNGLNYLYLINDKHYQVGSMRSVISNRRKTSYSVGLGGFGMFFYQKGDSALMHTYNSNQENLGVNNIFGIGGGILSGLGGFFSLGYDIYTAVTINGGIGLMYKEFDSGQNLVKATNPWLYQLNFSATIGYVRDKYYLNLSFGAGYFGTELYDSFREIMNVSKAKIAFGYKLFNKRDRR
jgi:hypothetical protein